MLNGFWLFFFFFFFFFITYDFYFPAQLVHRRTLLCCDYDAAVSVTVEADKSARTSRNAGETCLYQV